MTGIVAHTYPEWWLKLTGQVAHWSTDYSYKGQKVEQYIKRELGYRDVDAFKADDNVFKVLVESGKGSIEQLIKSVNHATAIVNNDFSINKSKYEIFVKSTINMSNLGKKGTNFDDFYKVLGELGVVI